MSDVVYRLKKKLEILQYKLYFEWNINSSGDVLVLIRFEKTVIGVSGYHLNM